MIVLTLPFPPSAELSMPGIYRITDVDSGRFYIGSAVNFSRRWKYHAYRLQKGTHPNPTMQAIWNRDANRLVVSIERVLPGATKRELLNAEQEAIDLANPTANRSCMNILLIAGSHQGRKRSKETVERLRAANLGRTFSEETRMKMRQAKLGGKLTPEHRAKIATANTGGHCNRPTGIINPALRKISPSLLTEMKHLREQGLSWSSLAKLSGMCIGPTRRAVLGITYRDATT